MALTAQTTTPAPRSSKERKREAILAAALELFAERGFHGTTVPSVAEKAGVGTGTIYRHFKSKEEMVNTLYRSWKSHLVSLVMANFPAGKPAREQFRWTWTRMAGFASAHPRAFAFLEFNNHRSYLDEDSRRIEAQLVDFAVAWVERAQADQVLKPMRPMMLLSLLVGAFSGVIRSGWDGRITLDEETLLAAEQCCWEAVRC